MYHWKIWYDDGSSHEGKTFAEWEAISKQGVLIVKEFRPKPKSNMIHMGCDYYWFEECLKRPNCGQIKSTNQIGPYLIRPRGIRGVKLGRWADEEIWDKAHEEALRYKGE